MKPKLLIVEDDEAIRTQLKYALRDDFTLFFAAGRAERSRRSRPSSRPWSASTWGCRPTRRAAE